MKKVAVIIAAVTISLAACHFRKDEAKESLERNEKYKGEKVEQGPAIDPAYVEANGVKTEVMVDTSDSVSTDTATHTEAAHAE